MEPTKVEFNGITFYRSPGAKSRSLRVYYNPGKEQRRQGVESLHREVYKAHHGPIPDGAHIHHRDGNPFNNDPANLVAVTRKQHARHHLDHLQTDEHRAHLDAVRPLAAEWHRSEEGRAWHREHGKQSWEGRETVAATCEECGAEYATPFPERSRYCSRRCINRVNERHRTDYEERACRVCGETFRARTNKPTEHCSKKCAWVTRRSQ